MKPLSAQQVVFVLSLLVENVWTFDAKDFTQSRAFILDNVAVACWYPISGNYGRLPRILFYCVITFALLASRYEWLIAGALAATLAYSGSAAIHSFLLVWRGPAYGELDLNPLLAILSTSCLIMVPLINWSSTLQKLGSRKRDEPGARMIIIYWSALMLVGLITILTPFWNTDYYGSNFSNSPITCIPPDSQMNFTAGLIPLRDHLALDPQWIQENGCSNPCQQSTFVWPPAIFRSYSDLQSLSRAEIRTLRIYLAPPTLPADSSVFAAYGIYGTVVGSFVLAQAIWALCFGQSSPRQARGLIYDFISGHDNVSQTQSTKANSTASKRVRELVAKYIATLAYFWAVLATILSVLLFITNIIIAELFLAHFPQSESAIHVGAWFPWTSTGLVLVATFIGKFHRAFTHSVYAPLQRMLKLQKAYQTGRQSVPENPSKNVGHALIEEWRLFKAFWKDPNISTVVNPTLHKTSEIDLSRFKGSASI